MSSSLSRQFNIIESYILAGYNVGDDLVKLIDSDIMHYVCEI